MVAENTIVYLKVNKMSNEINMREVWVVGMVGCIECSVPSGIYGVFDSEKEAQKAHDKMEDSHGTWTKFSGDGYWYITPMTINEVRTEYPFEEEE